MLFARLVAQGPGPDEGQGGKDGDEDDHVRPRLKRSGISGLSSARHDDQGICAAS